jgi:hypothetical protein
MRDPKIAQRCPSSGDGNHTTKPANLPVVQSTKFQFVIDVKTAKTIDLTIPTSGLSEKTRPVTA